MSRKEEPQDQVRPQQADGIQEFDNKLPSWWINLFYLCIVFAVVYPLYLYQFGGSSLIEEYNEGMQAISEQKAAKEQAMAASSEGSTAIDINSMLNDEAVLAAGKEIFGVNCMPCHGPDGGGTVGPNLTDKYWLHGDSPEAVLKIVTSGVPAKGMIAWEPVLGKQKVAEVSAYVLSLKGTTPANPKAPQGELIE